MQDAECGVHLDWPRDLANEPIAEGRQPMADSRWPTADGRRPPADGRRPKAASRWPTTDSPAKACDIRRHNPIPDKIASPLTRRSLLADAVARLEAAGVEDARRSAEWMLEASLGLNARTELIARPDEVVNLDAAAEFESAVSRRAKGEPVQYVLGYADFHGLRIAVTPAVLIPRPETEEVTEEALRRLEGRPEPWVLDVGTGSGAIALAIKQARPDAEVIGCDASTDALDVAAANAASLGLDVAFAPADALTEDFGAGLGTAFDLVISNPPYVPDTERAGLQREVRDWEPANALFVPGDDPLLFYRALSAATDRLLKPGGVLVVETHTDQAGAVRDLFVNARLEGVAIRRDMAGHERIVTAFRPLEER